MVAHRICESLPRLFLSARKKLRLLSRCRVSPLTFDRLLSASWHSRCLREACLANAALPRRVDGNVSTLICHQRDQLQVCCAVRIEFCSHGEMHCCMHRRAERAGTLQPVIRLFASRGRAQAMRSWVTRNSVLSVYEREAA